MATVSRDNIGILNDKLTITLTKQDYLPAFEQSLKKYAKTANIPGFRKGMVPPTMIKKMYGSNVFTEEVLRTVESELNKYMQAEKLDIFAQPLPLESDARRMDMNNPSDYVFAFEIGLKPAIDIQESNITVTRHRVDITEQLIDEEVERLKVRHGVMTHPEEVTSEENVLNVTFTESDPDGNVVEDGISKDNSVLVKYFAGPLRGELMGKKAGDSFVIQLSKAFEDKEREWIASDLGISGQDEAGEKFFKVLITKVGLIEKPEMDEAFFEKAFPERGLVNEDDFRKAVKEWLQEQWDQQTRIQLQDQIYHHLVDHTSIEFPASFLKRWMREGQENPKTAEEAEKEYPSFVNSLKWTLISTQLAEKYNISVEREDLRNHARYQLLSYMGNVSMGDSSWIEDYVDRMVKDKKFVDDASFQVLSSKIFRVLEDKVNVIEDVVTPEQLNGMQHHHSH